MNLKQPDPLPVSDTEREHFQLGFAVRPEVEDEFYPPDHARDVWNKIPEHLREGLRRYMMEFQRPGDFLCAVLNNDLAGALARADDVSIISLREISTYLYNCAPPECHGRPGAVDEWCARLVRARLEDSLGLGLATITVSDLFAADSAERQRNKRRFWRSLAAEHRKPPAGS